MLGAAQTADSTGGSEVSLGRRLAELRRARGLTLQQVGDGVGCTRSMVSAIERGRANPSLTLLRAIAQCLGTSLATLFEEAPRTTGNARDPSALRPEGLPHWQELPRQRRQQVVRRANRRRANVEGSQVVYELLSPHGDCAIELFHIVVAPGGSTGSGTVCHTGEEFVLVLQGRVRCLVGDVVHEIGPGDVLYYDSTLPHRWENPFDVSVELVTATTPPSF